MNFAKVVAVSFLGLVIITSLVCVTVIMLKGIAMSEGVLAMFSGAIGTAIGAIGGWLSQGLGNGKPPNNNVSAQPPH